MSCRSGGRRRREEYSDDDSEREDEDDTIALGDTTVNDWMVRRCKELEATVKSLQQEIWVLKSTDWKTKRQLRIDYDWDGEEANLSNKVSNWVRTYLFPRYKFLKEGWMEYSDVNESLLSRGR